MSTLLTYQKCLYPVRYAPLPNHVPEPLVNSTDKQPLLETPGEVSCSNILKGTMLYFFFLFKFNYYIFQFMMIVHKKTFILRLQLLMSLSGVTRTCFGVQATINNVTPYLITLNMSLPTA